MSIGVARERSARARCEADGRTEPHTGTMLKSLRGNGFALVGLTMLLGYAACLARVQRASG